MTLLEVEGLEVAFRAEAGEVRVVEGVSLRLAPGRILGLVGESGCGKSITARAVMRLLPEPPARVSARCLRFEGTELLSLPERRMREVRGNRIAMIFQEPMTSLNPTWPVGHQIEESLRLHTDLGPKARKQRVQELLRRVGIGAPERRAAQYPHQLSGGLRQRVMIAMALACEPRLLIADEPTTALDVTVQAQILALMASLRDELGTAILLITHDLGVVAEFCDEVAVMYAGRIVEQAPVGALFERPTHPYTSGLLAAMPRLDAGRGRLPTIAGSVPPPGRRPQGCPFHPRCGRSLERCREAMPPLAPVAGHDVACWNPVP
jgi:oligopeptide/dipeptide ABC transporter ATP-binding protein